MSLKDSKTEQNLKDAFAGESQANRRYLYFAAKADVELLKVKPAMPMVILSILKKLAILLPACRSAALLTTSKHQ